MADWLQSLIFGIVQGLTEFLPVSSSGHLELAKYILGNDAIGEESLAMSVMLHVATALSTVIIFRKDVSDIVSGLLRKAWNDEKRFALKIIISMIPAVLVGFYLVDYIEPLFEGRIGFVGLMLILTGMLLFVAEKATPSNKDVSYKNAFVIGMAQAIATLPGISRSGSTIATAVLLGIDKSRAAKFSFLMVVPLIFGKMIKDILDADDIHMLVPDSNVWIGFVAAFVTGLIACRWMLRIVKNSQLKYFAYYCIVVGLLAIVVSIGG